MRTAIQDRVCRFARRIMAERTGEDTELASRPDETDRQNPAPDELWTSPSGRYAVEHTRLESYEGQIENETRLRKLIQPALDMLAGSLPATYLLTVSLDDTRAGRMQYRDVHQALAQWILATATQMKDGETVRLVPTKGIPFGGLLHRRQSKRSQVLLRCRIEGDGADLRLVRVKRALDDKCPKLARWAGNGCRSLLVLEADDIQLSNVSVVCKALREALATRTDEPDLVIFVETDVSPLNGWVLKDGPHVGSAVPTPNGGFLYTEGLADAGAES